MTQKRDLTRAEIVRRRRSERALKEMAQTRERAVKPPVKVTSRAPTVPIVIVPRQKERRRYNVALGLPEIHLRKPKFSMPRFRANWRLASFLIVFALGVTIYLALTLPYFQVPAATVLGNNRYTREEINSVLGVAGKSIFTIQPEQVRVRLLTNYPELLSAEVKVYLPNHVYVTVTERQPVIQWQQGGGYTWIDAGGVAFRPKGALEGLVVVNGLDAPPAGIAVTDDPLSPPPFITKELVDAIIALSPLVPANTTMTYSAADGLGWTDPRGWRVAFGTSAHDMPLKIRVYLALVDTLTASSKVPEFISVVHPDGPFYRMAENGFEEITEENQ
ncbi:MAG: hypothetical protein DPW18_12755 [Chloroflexi bacterium]|nr:hypothetical protein [Chloroflexota bacterium]MDL1941907.1 FtsQ-type POTRA domain-containing protein [Chloroflexi bacterium CFX2]